jgi:D-serine deaminase-like pyridoxal phosphate-dependent protein
MPGFGRIVEHPGAVVEALSEEHGHVDVSSCPRPPTLGEVVTIVPNHACGVSNLHDEVVAVRGGRPVERWRLAARGAVR